METSIRLSFTFDELPRISSRPETPEALERRASSLERRRTFASRASLPALPELGYSSQLFVVSTVGAALFCDFLLFTIIIPIMPSVLAAIDPAHATETWIGVLFASKALVGFVANPLVSSVPPKSSMIVGICINAASAVGFAFFADYWLFLAARALSGIGSAMVMGGGMTLIMRCHAEEDRAAAGGYAMTGLTAGALSGPFIGGLVYTAARESQLAPFALVVACLGANAAMVLALRPLLLDGKQGDAGDAEKGGDDAADPDAASPAAPTSVPYSVLLTDSLVVTAAVAMGLQWFVIGSLEAIAPLYIQQRFALGVFAASAIWSVCPVSHMLNNFASAYLSTKTPYWLLVIAGELATAAGLVCMHLSGAGAQAGPALLALEVSGLFLVGVGMAYVVGAPLQGITSRLASARGYPDIGQLVAISNSGQQLGLILGPLAGAPAYQYLGAGVYYWGTAAVFVAFSACNCRFSQLDAVEEVDPAAKRADVAAAAAAARVEPLKDKEVEKVLRTTAMQVARSRAEQAGQARIAKPKSTELL